ncbi:MAG: T9SS C-terminal target domain-containing protein [Ignavibacteriae bacterium]|nr:MAG: T9SS C-terminal target domain-containing protein [Ignavibacteriota bacterium]
MKTKNYILKLIFLALLFSLSASTGSFANINSDVQKIDVFLQSVMGQSSANELIPIYIKFNSNLTLNNFNDISYDTPKKERRAIVISRLQNFAEQKQSSVKNFLTSRSTDEVQEIETVWLVNIIILKATPTVINQLAAAYNDISQICYNPTYPEEQMLDIEAIVPFWNAAPNGTDSRAIEPGILLMNADDCWALGNRGKGVTVANCDDGFWWRHPDLVHGIFQNLGEDANNNGMTIIFGSGTTSALDAGDINGVDNDGNGKIDDLIGWDFTTNNYNITTASHGSATMGHVVGDGTGGTQTGVAPNAKGICCRNSSGFTQQISAFQYAVLMGADVITSSLSWKWGMNPKPDYSLMRQATDMSLAAGVIHTNSTSNDGNSYGVPLNISSVGNCPAPWRHTDQQKVGNLSGVIGVGNVNCNTDVIASSSPWGPSTWGNWALWGTYTYSILPEHKDYPYSRVAPVEIPDSMGLLKPDVSAPGESSISTYVSSGTGYGTFGGTSSATPHTGGCVALMLSNNPEMLPRDVDRVLELTAIEKGDPGKDYRYGTGRIDALLATTSPALFAEGVNGASNWLLGNTTLPNDTARELVGLKFKNTASPWIGSLKKLLYNIGGTATTTDVEKFRLYWDINKNNIADAGDRLLKEAPFTGITDLTQASFDTLKFKVTDTVRHILLTIKTKSTAVSTHTLDLGMTNNTHIVSYYTTLAQTTNFPFGTVTGTDPNIEVPLVFSLSQNFPNPFNPATIITYSLAEKSFVTVKVFDAIGREIAILINNVRDAGTHKIEFDANFYKGLSSGIYFYKMEATKHGSNSLLFSDVKKMVLVK